jgi:hypothetical protein
MRYPQKRKTGKSNNLCLSYSVHIYSVFFYVILGFLEKPTIGTLSAVVMHGHTGHLPGRGVVPNEQRSPMLIYVC